MPEVGLVAAGMGRSQRFGRGCRLQESQMHTRVGSREGRITSLADKRDECGRAVSVS